MSGTTYYQGNREVMLSRADKYYENNKELLSEEAKNKYRELSEEEKYIKREYGRNRYHNMSEDNISINNKDIDIDVVIKVHFKIGITKIFFISASINF